MNEFLPIAVADRFEAVQGRKYLLAGRDFRESHPGLLLVRGAPPRLRAGAVLAEKGGAARFRVLSRQAWPAGPDVPTPYAYFLEAQNNAVVDAGDAEYEVARAGFTLAWTTLSDKGARGERVDTAGPLIAELIGEILPLSLVRGHVIPDESDALRALLTDLALVQGFDFIVTTGGTGVAPRDVTPEATLAVIDRRLPGYEAAMLRASLAKTPHGAVSRAVAGTLGQSLVVNLPGSPKAVRENLEPLLPTLRHTLEKLQGDQSDCAELHRDRR